MLRHNAFSAKKQLLLQNGAFGFRTSAATKVPPGEWGASEGAVAAVG
jgi:hypothetical protein